MEKAAIAIAIVPGVISLRVLLGGSEEVLRSGTDPSIADREEKSSSRRLRIEP